MGSMKMGFEEELRTNAARLSERGKGILASDESTGTIGKRLVAAGLTNDEETRRAFREVLYTAPGIGQFLSGAICFHETLYQKTADGVPFVDVMKKQGILPGIKVDRGLKQMTNSDCGETYTEGLDGLGQRCSEYYAQGARFAKWRAVIKVDSKKRLPTTAAIEENAMGLAQFASIAQANGLVCIVEPEILIDGTHELEVSAQVAEEVVATLFVALRKKRVLLEGTLLKVQMILPGASCERRATTEDIAVATIRAMRRVVPPAVPGIMFLSGGQSEEEATINLNTMNVLAGSGPRQWACPWSLSFSYGRALQSSVLSIWKGRRERVAEAQKMATELAKANAMAQLGKFDYEHPSQINHSLVEGFRGYRSSEDKTGL